MRTPELANGSLVISFSFPFPLSCAVGITVDTSSGFVFVTYEEDVGEDDDSCQAGMVGRGRIGGVVPPGKPAREGEVDP